MFDSEILKFLVPAVVAIAGWFVAHQFNVHRDRIAKRRDLRIQYLLDAYRRLEFAANRPPTDTEQNMNFESAVADIQLLGDNTQVELLIKFVEANKRGDGTVLIDPLLETLRNQLRKELGIEATSQRIRVFRFKTWDK